MKILFTSPIMEYPAVGGPQLRIENSVKALSLISDIYVVSGSLTNIQDISNKSRSHFEKYCIEFFSLPSTVRTTKTNILARKILRLYEYLTNKSLLLDVQFILDLVDKKNIDVVWFGYGNISFPLIREIKRIRPNLKCVCDTDSVWSHFILRELPYAEDYYRKLVIKYYGFKKRLEEKKLVNICDVVTAVSEIDALYYKSISCDNSRIHIFSNVIDIGNYPSSFPRPINFVNPSIYLAGSFGDYYAPMNSAARWVIEKILPKLVCAYPEIHFYIIGRNADIEFGRLNSKNITVTGQIESVLPYLCNIDVALVPLMYESGTRFKILEAAACKKPVVSTTLGAEGIPLVNGQEILLADDPDGFVNAIVKLLENKNLSKKIASNCYNIVKGNYSIEALSHQGMQIFKYLEDSHDID